MQTKSLNVYNGKVDGNVNNEYDTTDDAFRQPCLQMIVGQRTAGKSFLTSKILAQAKKDKTFNAIYIITPSFNSNRAYFKKYISEDNAYEPTRSSIQEVITRVENDRDEWEQYLSDKALYDKFKKDMKEKHFTMISADNIIQYLDRGFFDNPPEWKYDKNNPEPPKSLLILDDCLGSPAIMQSSGLTRIATLNRHVAPLKEDHKDRSACGLAVIILSQTYKMQQGIGRVLRENLSLLTLFLNKQEKQMQSIKEELGNVIDEDIFEKAYDYATKEKFGNLTIDFKPKCMTKTFRKNLNEAIMFDELKCECKK